MPAFFLTIERKISRKVRINANSAIAARAEIDAYGNQEAWSDYPCVQEIDLTRVTTVKRADVSVQVTPALD